MPGTPSKIRVLVADDEPLARRGVRQLLALHKDITIVAESRNGPETLQALQKHSPDLLFLDVQMPEMDGFDVLRAHGPERMPTVIFVTAYDQFAVRAFESHALDYLVKPLSVERFEAAISRARDQVRLLASRERALRLEALLAEVLPDEAQSHRADLRVTRIIVPVETGEILIPVSEIDWIAADDYYACLHVGGRRHLLRESLGSLEARLNPREFLRVHRSAIVQLDRVRELRTSMRGHEVILRDGTRIPLSRRRRAILEKLARSRQ